MFITYTHATAYGSMSIKYYLLTGYQLMEKSHF